MIKILLVDDDPAARSLPAILLRKWGYEVMEASDGALAWDILSREQIGFVISDWVMPNMTGIELCRKIRAAESDYYTYIILCTSKGEKADLIEGMEAGADDFLVKPINKEEMRVRARAGERVLKLERGLAERNRELNSSNAKLQAAYACIESDLKAAAWMQSNLLPSPARKTLRVGSEWRFRPSSYVAGDIFNVFAMNDRQVGFYLLDVSGHGVPAAMLSVTLSMVLSPDSPQGSPLTRFNHDTGSYDIVPPVEAVRELNRRFQTKDDRYFTMIYGLLDTRTGALTMTQAGHPNPVLIGRGRELQFVGEGGPPVGLWPGAEYDPIDLQLCPGDRLLLYSDGVSECASAAGELYGDERLLECLSRSNGKPLDQVLAGLETEIEIWRGGDKFDDDVSLLVLEFAEEENV